MEDEGSTTVMPKTVEGIIGWLESTIVTTSQTSIGQTLFKLIDSFLWVVEKCAQWSLPTHEAVAEENGKVFGKVDLVRPLPWVLFLPGLVILRIIRCSLNVGAFILRYPQIQPSGMVKFVQKGRRRLRAINLKAVKSTRRKTIAKDKRSSMIEAKKALIRSIKLTLSTLSCLDNSKSSPSPPPTKIRISHTDLETAATPDEKSTTESVESPIHHEMKRKYSQISSEDGSAEESDSETLESRLDRLAMNTSANDPDYEQCPETTTTDSSSASSENEVDKEVSLDELRELQEEMKEIHKTIDNEKGMKEDEKVIKNEKECLLVDLEDEDRTPNECTITKLSTTNSENEVDKEVPYEKAKKELQEEMEEIRQTIADEIATTMKKELEVFNAKLKSEKKECSPVDLEDEDRTKSHAMKCESKADDAKPVGSTESESQKRTQLINQFITGEMLSATEPVLPEASLTSEATNGVVPKKQKQAATVSTTEACALPQARTSISKENSTYERKGYKHKKTGRRY